MAVCGWCDSGRIMGGRFLSARMRRRMKFTMWLHTISRCISILCIHLHWTWFPLLYRRFNFSLCAWPSSSSSSPRLALSLSLIWPQRLPLLIYANTSESKLDMHVCVSVFLTQGHSLLHISGKHTGHRADFTQSTHSSV